MAKVETAHGMPGLARIWWVLGTVMVVATIGGATVLFISNEEASKRTPSFEQQPAQNPQRRAEATDEFPQLSLSLVGIAHGDRHAMALIATGSAIARPYGVGDEIATGVRLGAIAKDHVVVAHKNRSRVLYLKAGASEAKVISAKPDWRSAENESAKSPDIDPLSLNTTHVGATREFLREVRVARLPDGAFRVEEVDRESLYEKMGLRPGDIVNNTDIFAKYTGRGEVRLMGIYAGDAELEIVRDGAVVLLKHRPE